MQAFDGKEVEADLGEMEGGKSGQDGKPLRSAILQPVGKILEASKIVQKYFDAPFPNRLSETLLAIPFHCW